MFRLISRRANLKSLSLTTPTTRYFSSQQEWQIFPNESEGNNYVVNWSLCYDDITPVGNAYRNLKTSSLVTHLKSKVVDGAVEVKEVAHTGAYTLQEAGQGLSHDNFEELRSSQAKFLSSGVDLFSEDAGLGALSSIRVGVRVTSTNPAHSLIARNLLITIPPRPCNHLARFNRWNLDPKWASLFPTVWNEQKGVYEENPNLTKPLKGDRAIFAAVGGKGSDLALQFVQNEGHVVGATIVAGESVPTAGLIDALGHAASVLIGDADPSGLFLPSTSLFDAASGVTTVVLGADDSVVEAALAANKLHGAYHNRLSVEGVSAIWNGAIAPATAQSASSVPRVVSSGKAVVAVDPVNLVHPAKRFVFYSKGAADASLTEQEAVDRLVALTDESKKELISSIVKGATFSVRGTAAGVLNP